ncbi:hypothetical protein D3C75_1364960 [compost metagenome]
MTSVRCAHAKNGVSRPEQCTVNGSIGMGTRLRLDVGVLNFEQIFGKLDSLLLRSREAVPREAV